MNNGPFNQNQYNPNPQIYYSSCCSPYLNNQNPSFNIFIAIPQNGQFCTPYYFPSQQNPYILGMPQSMPQPYQNPIMQFQQVYQQPELSYPFGFSTVSESQTKNKKKVKKSHEKKSHKNKSEKKKSHKKHKGNSKKSKKETPSPLPKINPYCTFAATGSNGIFQRFYYCNTCGIDDDNVICEICANHCHQGHDLEFIGDHHGFCDCQSFGKCECMPTTEETRCVCEILGGKPSPFPLYQCNDCSITGDSYICQNCAIKNHHSHDLVVCYGVSDKMCHHYT